MRTTFTVDSAKEGIDVLPDSGCSNDDLGGPKGNGGGGGGNNGGNDNEGSEGYGESDDHDKASGGSALLLYCVYTMLPTNPVLASIIGFGMSASLLGVMGSRFKSRKIFPAGIVSFASPVMSTGYLHGILHSVL
ncbi:unnamed protein product [Fraxinus pennsylvanica]|uniref:Uncharacterized protein n=1 Tax=Fraxinus pennsylvanica TaxID=56036 RepID=A0AAD1YX87_9LAMI|nr:unnamed protein product [Fraxinus pennsylvanica]